MIDFESSTFVQRWVKFTIHFGENQLKLCSYCTATGTRISDCTGVFRQL